MSKKSLYRGSLSTIILKLLGDHDAMYGYEICQKVKVLTNGGMNITEGALYPALHKLEGEGFLSVEFVSVDNRTRKYYSLTKSGQGEMKIKLSDMEQFFTTMSTLLNPKTKQTSNG